MENIPVQSSISSLFDNIVSILIFIISIMNFGLLSLHGMLLKPWRVEGVRIKFDLFSYFI